MSDKLKELIKNLPELEPKKESVDKLVAQIIKKELRRLWEKRISIVTGLISMITLVLIIRKAIEVAKSLGTVGFWTLINNDHWWLLDEPATVWQAFLEANPLKEIGLLTALIAILAVSLYILFRNED